MEQRSGTDGRRRRLRRVAARSVAVGGAVIASTGLVAAPVLAQDTGVPPEFDAELAAEFEAELLGMLGSATGQPVDPSAFADLIGMPGDLDLPPGQLSVTMAGDAVVVVASGEVGGGSSLTGPCMGIALSFDGDGRLIDAAADFDPDGAPVDMFSYYESGGTDLRAAFTSKNPFEVDVNGFVAYTGVAGAAGDGPRNHSWEITSFGQALDSGGDDNADGKNRNAGTLDLGEQLPAPAKVNALFRIEGSMIADNGFACDGSGYIATTGGAPVLEVAGGVMVLIGGLGAVFNARPARTWRG